MIKILITYYHQKYDEKKEVLIKEAELGDWILKMFKEGAEKDISFVITSIVRI